MNFPQAPAGPDALMQGRKSMMKSLSLLGLVEKYLADNCSLSYINIDNMIDTLQTATFQFARMKRQVFAHMVRKAYFEYCQRNEVLTQVPPEKSDDIESGFLADSSSIAVDSDSDIEIQEEYQPRNDKVNTHLTNLYSGSMNGRKALPSNSKPDGNSKGNCLTAVIKNQVSPGAESTGSSDLFIPTSSNGSKLVNLDNPSVMQKQKGPIDNADDSDNDLEIIEEVIGDGVIRQTNGQSVSNAGEIGNKTAKGSGSEMVIVVTSEKENTVFKSSRDVGSSSSLPLVDVDVGQHVGKFSNLDSKRVNSILGNNATITVSSAQDATKAIRAKIIDRQLGLESQFIRTAAPTRGTKRKNPSGVTASEGLTNDMTPKKLKKEIKIVQDSGYRLADFAGSEKVVEEVCRLIMHLKHPEVYKTLGVTAPRGFLLHGPPGTGKTLLANALAGELQLPMLKVTGPEIISGISGESESNIRDLFNQALAIAPCIIFFDEIDSITPKRENAQREMERRIVAQLLCCVDDLMNHENGHQVLLIGATNRIESIDSALRRAGRFDREICLGIPDEKSRAKILSVICRNLRLAPGFDLSVLAKFTPGYVGADLSALVREAAVQAVNKALLESDKRRNKTNIETGMEDSIQNFQSCDEAANTSNEDKNDIPTPLVLIGDVSSEAEKITENVVNCEEENMEVDSSEAISSSIVDEIIEQVNFNVEAEKQEIHAIETSDVPVVQVELQQSISKEESDEPSHLRWIRESAPLSKNELDELYIFMDDFEIALKYVQPSSKREGFITVPDTTWDDIGALKDIREELEVSILGPVKHSSAFQMLALNTPAGVLLCGPPGCGKTLLAKAVANEAGINFISVKGPELLNMYVGESERAVRQCFSRAKNSSPCVIFFDELDALCPRRSDNPESGSGSRIVNQLLTEMDGMESRAGVFVMAATNRPDIIDPAILRPGRLDKILFVDFPTATDRFEILTAITKPGTRPILDIDVNMKEISEREECEHYTGADLAALVREASIAAFRDLVLNHDETSAPQNKDLKVSARHFETAFSKTKPSVTKKDRKKYSEMKEIYSSLRER